MSGISKTIKRVKGEIDFAAKGNLEPLYCEHLIDDTVTIITAYEQSQKELETAQEKIKELEKRIEYDTADAVRDEEHGEPPF